MQPTSRFLDGAPAFRRLAPGARVGLYIAGCLALTLVWTLCLWALCRPGPDVWLVPARYPVAASAYLAGTYGIWVGGALWTWRRWQGGTFAQLGLTGDPRWGPHLALGLVYGLASLGLLWAVELSTGLVLWGSAAWEHTPWTALLVGVPTAVFFGATEELLFRGFIYQTLRERGSAAGAIIASSGFYATVHFLRLDLGWSQFFVAFSGLWLAGALLAWTVERTGSLWLATGLHAAWVYLFFVSDHQHLMGYPATYSWLTGGGFPLGGLLAVSMVAALWGLLARAKLR